MRQGPFSGIAEQVFSIWMEVKKVGRSLKNLTNAYRTPKINVLRKPQFVEKNIPRGRHIKKISHTSPPIDIDATGDVLVALFNPIPIGLLTGMGVGSAMVRAFNQMATSTVETIKERTEEKREPEKLLNEPK